MQATNPLHWSALPKNRLTILEHSDRDQVRMTAPSNNNVGHQTPSLHNNLRFQHQQQHQSLLLSMSKYQLNDLVNLTCVSSPSFPAAHLSWLVNDQPIIAPTNQTQSTFMSPSATNNANLMRFFQLSGQHKMANLTARSNTIANNVPIESRLTISFRLDPKLLNHFISQEKDNPALNIEERNLMQNFNRRSEFAPQMSKIASFINLSCRAKIKIIYSSEASISLSSGQTSTHKQQRETQPKLTADRLSDEAHLGSLAPLAAPLTSEKTDQKQQQQLLQAYNYKWPANYNQRTDFNNNLMSMIEHLPADLRHQQHIVLLLGPLARQQQAMSLRLTKSEISNQMNQISNLLRQTRPNELENPFILQSRSQPETDNQERQQSMGNLQKLTCKARVGESSIQETLALSSEQQSSAIFYFKWLINKQEVS